jgi:hypothetical protein
MSADGLHFASVVPVWASRQPGAAGPADRHQMIVAIWHRRQVRTRHHHAVSRGRPPVPRVRPATPCPAANPGNTPASQPAAFTATTIKAATLPLRRERRRATPAAIAASDRDGYTDAITGRGARDVKVDGRGTLPVGPSGMSAVDCPVVRRGCHRRVLHRRDPDDLGGVVPGPGGANRGGTLRRGGCQRGSGWEREDTCRADDGYGQDCRFHTFSPLSVTDCDYC